MLTTNARPVDLKVQGLYPPHSNTGEKVVRLFNKHMGWERVREYVKLVHILDNMHGNEEHIISVFLPDVINAEFNALLYMTVYIDKETSRACLDLINIEENDEKIVATGEWLLEEFELHLR